MNAEEIVNQLLEEQVDVTVEYQPTEINGMPHIIWMIRAEGASPTQYLDKGTAHNKEMAEYTVSEKVRLLGVNVAHVVDNTR